MFIIAPVEKRAYAWFATLGYLLIWLALEVAAQ